MSIEEIEELIRKYLAAGVAVVVIIIAPGAAPDGSPPEPSVSVIEPDAPAPDAGDPEPAEPPARTDDRTGAGGRDPGREESANEPDDAGDRDGAAERAPAASAEGTGSEGTTAAAVHGWGAPDREDDFAAGTEQWSIYDGPGHAGEGTRSPSAVTVQDGILTITGDSGGTTAGMAWNPGQKYGRWEGRVRAPASDPSYNALLLLWPDAEDFPVGGEIDFMEMLDHTRQTTDIFIHYGADNSQVNGQVQVDGTEWHNWAVEWTPEAITAFVDGEEWYRTTDTSIFPPRPMHLCIQLDWFPEGDTPQESYMHVDWVRQYSLEGTTGGSDGTGTDGGGTGG